MNRFPGDFFGTLGGRSEKLETEQEGNSSKSETEFLRIIWICLFLKNEGIHRSPALHRYWCEGSEMSAADSGTWNFSIASHLRPDPKTGQSWAFHTMRVMYRREIVENRYGMFYSAKVDNDAEPSAGADALPRAAQP